MIWLRVLTCILLLLVGVPNAYAVSDQFTVTQQIGAADTEPPTVPQNVLATPVATDQIDITWDASTDNFAVAGYQVFRDSSQVATTTLTSYSDTGLTPDTLYAYTVTAFDYAPNYSTTSATSSTTTLAIPPIPPSPGGNPIIPRIENLLVVPEEYAATISWGTFPKTKSVLRWGETDAYELGSLKESVYSPRHGTRITGLLPDTEYKFSITATDDYGFTYVLAEESFTTLSLPDNEPPPNVSNFIATAIGNDALLDWENPTVDDFDRVRILRRNDTFPSDPFDGLVVYEGSGESFKDESVFTKDDTKYYAIFAYDEADNSSSGAVTYAQKRGAISPPQVEIPGELPEGFEPLRFEDLIFIQNGEEISFIGNEVRVNGTLGLEIRIPYDRLPEHLKTILLTFVDPNDNNREFSFLLRVNAEKTAYIAVLTPFGNTDAYPLRVVVFDFANRTLTKTQGTVITEIEKGEATIEGKGFFAHIMEFFRSLGIWLWILLLILLLIIIAYLAEQKKQKDKRRRNYARTHNKM